MLGTSTWIDITGVPVVCMCVCVVTPCVPLLVQVRQAAFQSLGRFISTFANPSSTGLLFREDGTLLEMPRCFSDRYETSRPPILSNHWKIQMGCA